MVLEFESNAYATCCQPSTQMKVIGPIDFVPSEKAYPICQLQLVSTGDHALTVSPLESDQVVPALIWAYKHRSVAGGVVGGISAVRSRGDRQALRWRIGRRSGGFVGACRNDRFYCADDLGIAAGQRSYRHCPRSRGNRVDCEKRYRKTRDDSRSGSSLCLRSVLGAGYVTLNCTEILVSLVTSEVARPLRCTLPNSSRRKAFRGYRYRG